MWILEPGHLGFTMLAGCATLDQCLTSLSLIELPRSYMQREKVCTVVLKKWWQLNKGERPPDPGFHLTGFDFGQISSSMLGQQNQSPAGTVAWCLPRLC